MHDFDYTDLLGKAFKFGERGPEMFDCWGLCLEVGKRAGIELPQVYTPAEMAAMNERFNNVRTDKFTKIDEPQPYCIVAFKMSPPIEWHAGIVLPNCNSFIHIMRKRSVVIERLDSIIWKQKLDGYYLYNS